MTKERDLMWEELSKLLTEIFDDRDFLIGMKAYLPTEENKKEMIDAIKTGWIKTSEEAIEYATSIYYNTPFEDDEPEEK